MTHLLKPAAIFLPVLLVVALTFVAFVRMATARAAAVKAGQDPLYYKAYLGPPEPTTTVIAVRHWANLFELPVLFYAGCIAAYALAAVNIWAIAFAWAFAVLRILQSAVHLTSNHTGYRGGFFVLGVVAVMALWVDVALAVFAAL